MSPARFALLSLLFTTCVADAPAPCADRSECAEGEICSPEGCRTVECVSSFDCDLHEYCSDVLHVCAPGCSEDWDCLAGESCGQSVHECFADACRSSTLDCGLGQVCEPSSGTCVDAPGCEVCTGMTPGECPGGECAAFPDGEALAHHCLYPCLSAGTADECGRGFTCQDLSGSGDLYCYAECPVLLGAKATP